MNNKNYTRDKFNIIPYTINLIKPENKYVKKIYNNVDINVPKVKFLFMYPNITIKYKQILEIYNIKSINNLIDFINNSLQNNIIMYYDEITMKYLKYTKTESTNILPFDNINRVFIAWLHENIDVLKTHNHSLINICYTLIGLTLPPNFMEDDELKKHIKNYIEYWFNIKNIDDYSLNLIKDMNIYFNEKFPIKK
jgi:hypothetical protein